MTSIDRSCNGLRVAALYRNLAACSLTSSQLVEVEGLVLRDCCSFYDRWVALAVECTLGLQEVGAVVSAQTNDAAHKKFH